MKKWLTVAVVVVLLVVSGCASKDETNKDNTVTGETKKEQNNWKQLGLNYLEQFNRGDFDIFYQNVTSEFGSQVSKEMFSTQWAAVAQMSGKMEKTLEQTMEEKDNSTVVTTTDLYTLRQVVTTFSFNSEGKVDGSYVKLLPLKTEPQETDQWEEHPIQIGLEEKKVNGLLTLPKNIENPPVVLLLQGSGPSNMDEKIGTGGNKPFADIAHGLAENNVASIRYDKRTYAYPEDAAANPSLDFEYYLDAKAAIQLVMSDSRVDKDNIFLLGHSEGGMLAPKISKDNPEIKGFVSLAGSLRGLEDLSLTQTKIALEQNTSLTEEQRKETLAQTKDWIDQVKNLEPDAPETVIAGISSAMWNDLNAVDGPALVKELNIPMLVLQGDADFQVSSDIDYPLWKKTLQKKTNATFILYPGLNHLFMKGGSKDFIDISVYNIPSQVEPQVILDIANWVQTNS